MHCNYLRFECLTHMHLHESYMPPKEYFIKSNKITFKMVAMYDININDRIICELWVIVQGKHKSMPQLIYYLFFPFIPFHSSIARILYFAIEICAHIYVSIWLNCMLLCTSVLFVYSLYLYTLLLLLSLMKRMS